MGAKRATGQVLERIAWAIVGFAFCLTLAVRFGTALAGDPVGNAGIFPSAEEATKKAITRANATASSDAEGWANMGVQNPDAATPTWLRLAVWMLTGSAPVCRTKAQTFTTTASVTAVSGAPTYILNRHVYNADATVSLWCCTESGDDCSAQGFSTLAGSSADFDTSDAIYCQAGSSTVSGRVTFCGFN